jgi:7-cyano-7-deazaguanine synthase in queuosine biosynthesis
MNEINVDGVLIPYEKYWNFAVSVSGGADSALLAYLLCKEVKENKTVHIINHKRMWKTRPWQEYDARRVYEYLQEKFPNITFVYHKNFIAPELEYGNIGPTLTDEYGKKVSGDNIQQRAFAEYICHKFNIDAYYNAVTRNPRSVDLNGMKERDIELNEDNKHLRVMQHMDKYAIHPFRFVEKDWIIKQYIDNNITDLLELTRSCEGEFKDLDYKTYKPFQHVPTCGECFWCKEREWAIEKSK